MTIEPPTERAAGDALLDAMQFHADPLADDTIERIVGTWPDSPLEANAEDLLRLHGDRWRRLEQATAAMSQWQSNGMLHDWQPPADLPADIGQALQSYLRAADKLPHWHEPAKIARAEKLFFDYGPLSCMLLFCASLPECYVVPDLSEVLQTTGQLSDRTEHRIRATAAMIFPVMMHGGLTQPHGGGLAQVLKVRLIHAAVRNLILRAEPEQALRGLREGLNDGAVAPLLSLRTAPSMHQALFAHGWNIAADGLPCNQEELAYTLLTFHFVFLRGMRTLRIGLDAADEDAYLHTWNVVGHLVGIQPELIVRTMDEAQALFARMQARGRAQPVTPDPRPLLGSALMDSMARVIPLGIAKPFPVLLARMLCGQATARDIGIDAPVPWLSRAIFALVVALTRGIDAAVRLVWPRFSLVRLITRLLGYHLVSKLLMDETRPLKLPSHLRERVRAGVRGWRDGVPPAAPLQP
jgi:hypothetical protein